MNEEIKIDRLERIMEVAKMMHYDLLNRKIPSLARQAADIYATAKEEIEARSMLKEETVTDCNRLPDWCKAGEWVYDNVIGEYAIVKKEENPQWYVDNLETLSPARKRSFNTKEMKALVGKVIEKDNNLYLVTAYHNDRQTIITGNASSLLDAELLIVNNFTIDGKPCYVMEHKNDKGEWVK